MKKRLLIVAITMIIIISFGVMKNTFSSKPLQLGKDVQELIDLMEFDNCYLIKFDGLENIEKQEISPYVTEEEIEEYIEYTLQENAYRKSIINRNLVEMGDLALADYTIMNGTEQVNSVKDAPIRVGSGYYDTFLESAILGMETGKEYTINWKVPSDVDNAEWAGKELKIHITIKELYEVLTPSVEEYTLQNGFESIEKYRKHVETILLEDREKELTNQAIESVLEILIENSKFQIAEEVVVENAIQYYYEYKDLAYIYETNLDEFFEKIMSGEDDIYEKCYARSLKDIQTYLIIGRYAREEGIEVLEKEVKEYYKKNNLVKEEISEEELTYIKYQLLEKKVLNSLADKFVELST